MANRRGVRNLVAGWQPTARRCGEDRRCRPDRVGAWRRSGAVRSRHAQSELEQDDRLETLSRSLSLKPVRWSWLMPRFFFDMLDGREWSPDEEGLEFPDLDAARRDAQVTIGQVVKDIVPDGNEDVIVLRIRDDAGKTALMISNVMTTVQMG
jgi:hypothetical protein